MYYTFFSDKHKEQGKWKINQFYKFWSYITRVVLQLEDMTCKMSPIIINTSNMILIRVKE